MRRRLVAALTVMLLWVVALVVVDRGAQDSPAFVPAVGEDAAWEREVDFLHISNMRRLGDDPLLSSQNNRGTHPNPNAVRILAVGDSATFGTGVSDLSMRWQERLERLLDRRTRPGTFDVTTLAMYGASTYRFADWLTPELIARVDPDLIIIAVNGNDVVPTGDERLICPEGGCPRLQTLETTDEFRSCMTESVRIPAADRPALYMTCLEQIRRARPDVTYSEAVENNALLDGRYGPQLRLAHQQVIAAAGRIPVAVFPTYVEPGDIWNLDRLIDIWESFGARRTPMTMTTKAVKEREGERGVWVHPRDRHPGPVITAAYAADLAELVLQTLPPARLAAAERTAQDRPISLVDNYLPAHLEFTADDRTAQGLVFPWTVSGDALNTQFFPCAEIGRLHARLMFDPRLQTGTVLDVRVEGVDAVLYGTGYVNEAPATWEIGPINSGATRSVTIGDRGLAGVLVAPAGASDCEVPMINLAQSFQVEVRRP